MVPFTLITYTRRIPKGTRLNLKAHLSDIVTVKTAEIPYGNRVQVLPYADTLEGLTGNIFDTLVKYDSEMNLVPNIAESWEVLSDTSVQFNIREGIKFHDGSDLTAKDVKYSIERILDHVEVAYIIEFVKDVEI